ncbi:MAG: LppX_LprAFG lipoprotein [Actinomycetota bacterium]|jgi:LppX_LprAFG lipoprotein
MKRSLLALTALSVLASCAEGGTPISPRDAVLDAMTAVYEAGSYHQELRMSMSAEGQSFSITAEADVDNATKQAAMTMDLGMMGGEMEMVMDDGVIYMRSPAFEGAPTPWVSLDPSKMDPAAAGQFGGFGAGTTDPSAYAGLFAGVFDVKASGEADIDGIATTRYTGTIDLQKVLEGFADVVGEDADAKTTEQLEAAVEQFEALGIEGKIPFQIWIDEEGLPRRQRITMDFGDLVPGTGDAEMEMTVDYSAFGEPVDVELPKASEVTDVTKMMSDAGAAGEKSGAYG